MKNPEFWKEVATVTMEPKTFQDLQRGRWASSLYRDPSIRPFLEDRRQQTYDLDDALECSEEAFRTFASILAGASKVTPEILAVYRRCSEVV